jgi:hypothetical protein
MMIQPGLSQFFYDVDGSFKTWFEASSSSHGSSPVNHVFALPHIPVWLKTRDRDHQFMVTVIRLMMIHHRILGYIIPNSESVGFQSLGPGTGDT